MSEPRIRRGHILTITVDEDGLGPRVRFIGEIDLSNIGLVEDEFRRIEDDEPRQIIVDHSELRYIDSMGLSCLLHAAARSRERVTELRFVHGPNDVERVFELAGVADVLPFARE